jgi:prepilin-type N-terminal cleavage/methylation domain-containing protein
VKQAGVTLNMSVSEQETALLALVMKKRYKQKVLKKNRENALGERGFSLVETMIATLLISVVVTSVFSLAFTSKVSSIRVDRRSVAIQAITQAREKIKSYVTADKNVMGPNAKWKIPEDDCGPTAEYAEGDCPNDCYALDVCTHNVTRMLPTRERDDPKIQMRLTYTVTKSGDGHKVTFNTKWEE